MTIDSNIIIGYLNGDATIVQTIIRWRKAEHILFLSSIVEMEVLSASNLTDADRLIAQKFLEENFTFFPFDRTLARIAALCRARWAVKGFDAAVAATALYTHTPIVTRNVKDFRKIPDLQIVEI